MKRSEPPVPDPDAIQVQKRLKESRDKYSGFALRKSEGHLKVIRAYKCKLNQVIRGRPAFRTVVTNLVNDVSQLTTMASDLLNVHFLRLLSEGQDVPDLNQQLYREALCLCMNNTTTNAEESLFVTYRDHFFCPGVEVTLYGAGSGRAYNGQVISSMARDMATNAETMMYTTLKKRTLRLLKLVTGFGNAKVAKAATKFVYGDDDESDHPLGLVDESLAILLAMQHRDQLGLASAQTADKDWIKASDNYQAIVRYLYWIQCEISVHYNENGLGKNFSLLPHSSIRRKMIEIDNDAFFLNVLPAAMSLDPQVRDDLSVLEPVTTASKADTLVRNSYWSHVFDFKRILRSSDKWRFNHTIRTDGCAISVYQWRWKTDGEYRRRQFDDDDNPIPMDLWSYDRGLFATGELESNGIPDNVDLISIDPGNATLMTALHGASGESWSLGKKQHQAESGVRDAVLKQDRWQQANPAVRSALDDLSQTSGVGPDLLEYWHYVAAKYMHWPALWGEYGDAKYSNLSFTKYRRRLKSIDSFIQKLLHGRDVRRTVVAFGAGRWPTTRKGEITGPLVGLARRLSIYVKTVYTQERYTSKRCYDCHQDLSAPRMDTTRRVMKGGRCVGYKHSVANAKGVWGLKQCLNTDCESYGCLVNRDWNACWNISEVFIEWMRERRHPLHLRRDPLHA